MISKHQDEDDSGKSGHKESAHEEEKDICVTVTTNEEYNPLDAENRIHVNITENNIKTKKQQNTIKVENHKCNKCKKYFYTHKSLLTHNKNCKEETSNSLLIDCSNPIGKELFNNKLKKLNIDSQISKDEDNDSFTSEPSIKPFINNLEYRKEAVISGVNFKLFKVKEKLFDIMQFIMFEKSVEDNTDTEKIYRNIYKSISSCISNILIDEQEILLNKSIPSSPRSSCSSSGTRLTRRGSWSTR